MFFVDVSLLKVVVRHKQFNAELAKNAKNEVKRSAHGIIEIGLYLSSSVLNQRQKLDSVLKFPVRYG